MVSEAGNARKVLPLLALAAALGRPKGSLSRWSRLPWFPAPAATGGWDVEEVRAALARHARGSSPRERATTTAAVSAQASRPAPAPDPHPEPPRHNAREALSALVDGGDSPVDIARAGVRLASALLLRAHAKGEAMPRDLDALKKTLEELRRSEAGYLDLAKRRGELIERSEAAIVAARLARMLVEMLGNVEARLGAQVAIWMADRTFGALSAEEQGRSVRGWFGDQARALREVGAREIEAMIEEARP